ncbi:MAG: EamA family transporter [Acidobacteriota bacterium]
MTRPSTAWMIAAYVLLIVIWGTTWSAIQVGLERIPPLGGVAIRFLLAGALLWAIARARGVPLGRKKYEKTLWWINAGLAFALSYGIVYWAEQWIPSGLAAVLFATYPLFVGLIAHLALPGERLTAGEGFGMVLGFAGVATIFSADFGMLGGRHVFVASVVMLGSPAAAAIATVYVKRWGGSIHPLSLTAVPMIMAGAAMGVIALVFERGRTYTWDGPAIGALLYLAVIGSAVTFTLYYWLLAHLPAKRLALIAYLIPLIAVTIGTLRGEKLTSRILLGSVTVIAGVALALHIESRRKRANSV